MKLRGDAKEEGKGTSGEGEVVRVLECPECGGHNVVYTWHQEVMRLNHCRDCGYKGSFVIERKVLVRDDETVEEI